MSETNETCHFCGVMVTPDKVQTCQAPNGETIRFCFNQLTAGHNPTVIPCGGRLDSPLSNEHCLICGLQLATAWALNHRTCNQSGCWKVYTLLYTQTGRKRRGTGKVYRNHYVPKEGRKLSG
jgi:hypothetical protein